MKNIGLELSLLDTFGSMLAISTPATPPSSQIRVYAKASGGTTTLCIKNDAGTELCLPTTGIGTVSDSPSGANNQVAFFTAAHNITGDSTFTWDNTNKILLVQANSFPTLQVSDYENNGNPPLLILFKARGTIASPSGVAITDLIGDIRLQGRDSGGNIANGAIFRATATETWGATARGTSVSILTTLTGGTSAGTRVFIDGNGRVGIGNTNPRQPLDVGDGTTSLSVVVNSVANNFAGFRVDRASTEKWFMGMTNSGSEEWVLRSSGANNFINVFSTGSVVLNTGALLTTATDGFLYIATCNGTPIGAPTGFTGRVAMVYDTSANKIWFYNGSWRGVLVT